MTTSAAPGAPAGSAAPDAAVALDPSWRSWDGLHGGYLVARLAAAARAALPEPLPLRAVHANLLGAVREAEAGIGVGLLRAGRTVTTARAELSARGRTAVTATATFGPATAGPAGHEWHAPPPPAVPPAAERPAFGGALVDFADHIEIRPADDRLPLSGGDEPELTAWMRLHRPPSDPAEAVLILLDAPPPALYGVLRRPVAIPTVELAAHLTGAVAGADPGGWMLTRIRTEHAAAGWCVDNCTLWNADGGLLATGRQTRRLLVP
ncbi:thioesterase family protein [Streptomyces aidingensis]|uniref:Acyl-CoA thioesterase n=1 Tax=Streptomyces aidingensis TaxID=910347 RepID=A0A1I1LM22_9ACTN|nr:thioesterase family protein [Streptomyces aidingensis]SFC71363.1 Acyl-CoA thioesterase [Streptomyces aidingensis]